MKNWECDNCYNGMNIDAAKPAWCDKCWCDKLLNDKLIEEEWATRVGYVKKKQRKVCKYLWYSVRPGPNNSFTDIKFKQRIDKLLSCKQIKNYIYCLEWKWGEKGGPFENDRIKDSIHAHIIIEPEMNMIKYVNTHIDRQKEKFFNLNDKQRFYIYDEQKSLLLDKLDYIDGITFDDNKNYEKAHDKQRMVNLFSKEHITKYQNETCETWRVIVKETLQN